MLVHLWEVKWVLLLCITLSEQTVIQGIEHEHKSWSMLSIFELPAEVMGDSG